MLVRYRPAAGALFATLTDGAVVLDVGTKKYFTLNDTGAAIWTCIRDGLGTDAMVAVLQRDYDVSEDDALTAVQVLIDALESEQLIEPAQS
jgi:hypothetical protein